MAPALAHEVAALLNRGPQSLALVESAGARLVADASLKYRAVDADGRSVAFVLYAPEGFPGCVAEAAAAARRAREVLGDELGPLVLLPIAEGTLAGRSLAVYPHQAPLRPGPLARFMFRRLAVPKLMRWLAAVSARTSRQIAEREYEDLVARPLAGFRADGKWPQDIQAQARAAAGALAAGQWRPAAVFAHNDLWQGNVLLQSRAGHFAASHGVGSPRIIDWLASSLDGAPGFDALTLARTSGVSPGECGRMLQLVGTGLRESPAPAFDLLAGLGRMGLNREEFPFSRYRELVVSSVRAFGQATGGRAS